MSLTGRYGVFRRLVIALKLGRAQIREVWRIVSIRPPAPPRLLARVGFWSVSVAIRELSLQLMLLGMVVIGALLALGATGSAAGLVALALVAAATAAELRLTLLSLRTRAAVENPLEGIESEPGPRMRRSHLAFPFLMLLDRQVKVRRGLVYQPDSKPRLRVDVYEPRAHDLTPGPRPAVIQVHGGGWISGSRLEQGIPLLNHLAATGWVGLNIDYRLSPQASWPDHIVDVKRAIAWARENADELEIDHERICITGGSAGGHLSALAGLTENDPAFQPGFEDADTSISAAVPFYGIYDLTDADGIYYPQLRDWVLEQILFKARFADDPELFRSASPRHRVHPDAPPFMVIHGDRDSLVPVADARTFTDELSAVARNPVRYLELAGGEHAFDLLPSPRSAPTVEAIERFLRAMVRPRTHAAAPSPAG
ncbi:hypothetical protein BH20ACT15_BH20ACT15_05250 [soil metagenome]